MRLVCGLLMSAFCSTPHLLSAEAVAHPRWQSTGPFCATAQDFAGDPALGDLAFLTLRSGGLLRSRDDGRSWQRIGAEFSPKEYGVVAYDAAHAEYLYYANDLDGLFRSRDGGVTWQEIGTELGSIGALSVPPDVPGALFVHTASGLSRSLDGGESFSEISIPGTFDLASSELVFHPQIPRRLWLISDGGLYRSEDLGDSFVGVPFAQPPNRPFLDFLTVAPDLPSTLFFASFNQLYRNDGTIFLGTTQHGVLRIGCLRGADQACLLNDCFRVRGTM